MPIIRARDRELPAERSLRIVERDLEKALTALERLACLADEATRRLERYDAPLARDYRERIWLLALSLRHAPGNDR